MRGLCYNFVSMKMPILLTFIGLLGKPIKVRLNLNELDSLPQRSEKVQIHRFIKCDKTFYRFEIHQLKTMFNDPNEL